MPRRPSIRLKRKEKVGKEHFSPQARFDFLISLPVIVLVVVFYFWTAMSNGKVPNYTSKYYYPLLGRAFVEGHLYLDVQPLPQLLALSDPYDPHLNQGLRLHDASLYNGKYYIYFGPTPAVLLFAPWFIFTYGDFPEDIAVALFCSLGFIISAQLFLMILRDHFPRVPIWLKLACVLSLGMADTCPFLIRRPEVYEVAISCAYFILQLVFLFFYQAVRRPHQALTWLLLTSLCLGGAVGARPNYTLIVFVFIGFLIWMWWQKALQHESRAWLLFWALAPVGVIGLLLAWYNYARFDNPLEFGTKYALCGIYVKTLRPMELQNMPVNIWFYFFNPPWISWKFPFIQPIPWAWFALPDRYYGPEKISSLFLMAPVSLFVLTLPVLVRKADGPEDRPLVLALIFMAVSVGLMAISILLLNAATMRYLVDFAPTFVLLGCLMVCYFYAWISRQKQAVRRFLQGLLITILFLGCANGLFLSFTGYYDYLRIGSPETYAALEHFFRPLELAAKAIANLFGM